MVDLRIPGRNANYLLDTPFFTLKSASGHFLSNPYAIVSGQTTQTVDAVTHGKFQDFTHRRTYNVAVSKFWDSAWVVYEMDALRELQAILAPYAHTMNTLFPSEPYSGMMTLGDYDMITCHELFPLPTEATRPVTDWTRL